MDFLTHGRFGILLLGFAGVAGAQGNVATGTDTGVAAPRPIAPRPIVVRPIALARPVASVPGARKALYAVTVKATGGWMDAGFAVTPADHLAVTATGMVTLGDARRSGPAGVARGWKDLLRAFPAEGANVGALLGRVGDLEAAVPFALGASVSRDVPASGELFLAVNVGEQLAGTGAYKVTLRLTKAAAVATTASPVVLEHVVTPELMAAIPRRVADQQGDAGDVVNFALLGTAEQVTKAFAAAGWVQVDRTTDDAVIHGLLATLSKQAYLAMPMSVLYLYGRPQDMSYARADPLVVAMVRHHLRVWSSGLTVAGRPLWVGSATHDNGLERDQRTNGWTHHIDPKIDVERDFIEQSFAAAGVVDGAAYVTPADPVRDARTATGGSFETDGRVLVMVLR